MDIRLDCSKKLQKILDRQIRLWGFNAQNKLLSSDILIVGMSSSNVEAAKNLALAGVGVSLLDRTIVQNEDIFFNFLIRDEDVGKRRAEASLPRLMEISPMHKVSVVGDNEAEKIELLLTGSSDNEEGLTSLEPYTAICVAGEMFPLHKMTVFDSICRKANKGLFVSSSCGLLGFLFMNLHTHQFTQRQPLDGSFKNSENCEQKEATVVMDYPSLLEMLQMNPGRLDRRIDKSFSVFLALQTWESQMNVSYAKMRNCFKPENMDSFEPFYDRYIRDAGREDQIFSTAHIKYFYRMYNRQFAVTGSVLGGIIGQETRKFITGEQMTLPNCLAFDFDASGVFVAAIPPGNPPRHIPSDIASEGPLLEDAENGLSTENIVVEEIL